MRAIFLQFSWKMVLPKLNLLWKWLKDLRLKRKENGRLQRAELDTAISVASVVLAALAAGTAKSKDLIWGKEAGIASAATKVQGLVLAYDARARYSAAATCKKLTHLFP